MSVLEKHNFISEEDYLRVEESAEVKHEYVSGTVYAMSGAKNQHNEIAMNCGTSLQNKLRGSGCKPFNSDTKVRIRSSSGTRFYYPDTMVVCDRNRSDEVFQDNPVLIIEVLSDSTRRTDETEKMDAYFLIPTLETYLLIEQNEPKVVAVKRTPQGYEQSEIEGLDQSIEIPHLKIDLPLKEIYEDIEFD